MGFSFNSFPVLQLGYCFLIAYISYCDIDKGSNRTSHEDQVLLLVMNNLNPAKFCFGTEMRCDFSQSHPYSRIHNAIKLTKENLSIFLGCNFTRY